MEKRFGCLIGLAPVLALAGLATAGCARGPRLLASTALVPSDRGAVTRGSTARGLYYEDAGRGQVVVLIHAFSVDSRMWEEQVAVLQPSFRVIRYDLRGHGRSAAATEPFAAHDDLLSLIDELHVERASLVGLSAGARIAIDFALVHPERVTRLVLASPGVSGYVPKEPMSWMDPVIQAARAGEAERAAALWAATPLMAISGDSAAAATVRSLVLANASLWRATSNPERPLTPPALDRLSQITIPVLVMVGENDLPDTHQVAEILTTGIAGARRVLIPGAGHMLNLAAPRAFDESLKEFLSRD